MQQSDFTSLYKQQAPAILRMCRAYAIDEAEAQDLLQETFIKVWQHVESFKGESKMSTWIYRIAVNTCLSHIRSKKTKPIASNDLHIEKSDDDSGVQKEADVQQLYKAIKQLPEADRLIISMVLDQVSYEDIASSMAISEGNLRVKIHRIKLTLTKIFFDNE